MAYNTTTSQGTFVGTGQTIFLNFPSGVDWIDVYNYTQTGTSANPSASYQFHWQRPVGVAVANATQAWFNTAGSTVANTTLLTGSTSIQYIDTSNPPQFSPVAITAGTNAVQPVFSTGSTAGLFTGSIVRVTNLATAPNLNGYDFSIDTVVTNTSFRVKNPLANAPGSISGAGSYRLISSNALIPGVSNWYPSVRRIVNITQAFPAVVTTSVDSNYIPGQLIRLNVPAAFGMTQADGLLVTVLSVTGGLVTINLDTTGFSAFVFPLVAAYPFSPAETIPVGQDTSGLFDPNLLNDATTNVSFTGLMLPAGINAPGGQLGDVVYWIGGKTFNGS